MGMNLKEEIARSTGLKKDYNKLVRKVLDPLQREMEKQDSDITAYLDEAYHSGFRKRIDDSFRNHVIQQLDQKEQRLVEKTSSIKDLLSVGNPEFSYTGPCNVKMRFDMNHLSWSYLSKCEDQEYHTSIEQEFREFKDHAGIEKLTVYLDYHTLELQ